MAEELVIEVLGCIVLVKVKLPAECLVVTETTGEEYLPTSTGYVESILEIRKKLLNLS